MAGHERFSRKNQDEVEPKHRLGQKKPQPISDRYHGWDEDQLSISETPFWPQAERHTALLAMPLSDEQRTRITLQLQQNYGNKYVQRVIEQSRLKTGLEKSPMTKTSPDTETAFRQDVEESSLSTEMSSAILYVQRIVEKQKPPQETKKPPYENKLPAQGEKGPAKEEKGPAQGEKGPAKEEKAPVKEEKAPANEEEQLTNITDLESAIALLKHNIKELKKASGKEIEKWFGEVITASNLVKKLGGDKKWEDAAYKAILEGGKSLLKHNIKELQKADFEEKEKWIGEVFESASIIELFGEKEDQKLVEEAHKAALEEVKALLKHNIKELQKASGKEKEKWFKDIFESTSFIELFGGEEDKKLVEEGHKAVLEEVKALLKQYISKFQKASGMEKTKWFKEIFEATHFIEIFGGEEEQELIEEGRKVILEIVKTLFKHNIKELRKASGKIKEEKAKEILDICQFIQSHGGEPELIEEVNKARLEVRAYLP